MHTYDDLIDAGIQEREKFIKKQREVIEYALEYVEMFWAAKTIGIILDCDFRDSEKEAKNYLNSFLDSKNGT